MELPPEDFESDTREVRKQKQQADFAGFSFWIKGVMLLVMLEGVWRGLVIYGVRRHKTGITKRRNAMKNEETNLDKMDMITKNVSHVKGIFSMLITLAVNNSLPDAAKCDPEGLSCIFEDAQGKLEQIQEMSCALHKAGKRSVRQ